MEELKPCPFCGSSAEFVESWIPRSKEISIRCSGDKNENRMGCPASTSEQDEQGGFDFSCYGKEYLPKLIETWNSRPIEDQLRAENERLREALSSLYEACMKADEQWDLSEYIDGSILDRASEALNEVKE